MCAQDDDVGWITVFRLRENVLCDAGLNNLGLLEIGFDGFACLETSDESLSICFIYIAR